MSEILSVGRKFARNYVRVLGIFLLMAVAIAALVAVYFAPLALYYHGLGNKFAASDAGWESTAVAILNLLWALGLFVFILTVDEAIGGVSDD